MNYFTCTIIIIVSISISAVSTDSCPEAQCKCSQDLTVVNCDSKPSLNLSNIEFPSEVVTLTLINDRLKFDTSADRSKIANLSRLQDLSLNHNPLTIIPSFNISSLRSLSLQDTSLTSVEFPPSYSSSILQTVILSDNKIRSIASTDFAVLKNTKTKRLHIDSASLTTIDQNAFTPLSQLQSLSLNKNQLKSCDFLSTLRVLSSIKLDGNIFTSLPQQLSTPNDIKIFSFKNNNISIIDESSSLFVWQKKNWTNMRVYLEKNPLIAVSHCGSFVF
ncbi:hypothetical protein I4U23_014662 [Adineta vaga]|nr:hypothetical protein I4U23_014662 [Adineta vaga]